MSELKEEGNNVKQGQFLKWGEKAFEVFKDSSQNYIEPL